MFDLQHITDKYKDLLLPYGITLKKFNPKYSDYHNAVVANVHWIPQNRTILMAQDMRDFQAEILVTHELAHIAHTKKDDLLKTDFGQKFQHMNGTKYSLKMHKNEAEIYFAQGLLISEEWKLGSFNAALGHLRQGLYVHLGLNDWFADYPIISHKDYVEMQQRIEFSDKKKAKDNLLEKLHENLQFINNN